MFKAKCKWCNSVTTGFIARSNWYLFREYRSRIARFFLGPKDSWLCNSCFSKIY